MCSSHHAFADRVKKEGGAISLVCEFDVDSLTSKPPKGKIGWLPQDATPCTVNQYDKLFNECEIAVKGDDGKVNVKEVSAEEAAAHKSKETGKEVDFIELFNPDSLKVCTGALVEQHAAASLIAGAHPVVPLVQRREPVEGVGAAPARERLPLRGREQRGVSGAQQQQVRVRGDVVGRGHFLELDARCQAQVGPQLQRGEGDRRGGAGGAPHPRRAAVRRDVAAREGRAEGEQCAE